MDRNAALALLTELAREEAGDDTLTLEAGFGGLPKWDSLNHVGLVMALERRIGRRLTTAEIDRLDSVEAFVALLSGG